MGRMGWDGYLLGPTLRAPYGANNSICGSYSFSISIVYFYSVETNTNEKEHMSRASLLKSCPQFSINWSKVRQICGKKLASL